MSGDDPKLVVVFCSDGFDLPALIRGVNDATGGVPLIGCSTGTGGFHNQTLVVLAVS